MCSSYEGSLFRERSIRHSRGACHECNQKWLSTSSCELHATHKSGPFTRTLAKLTPKVSFMEEESVSITALPTGSMHQIFSYLPPKDLCCVSATCKYWRELSHDQASNMSWKHFYEQRWTTVRSQSSPCVCWQTEYGSKMKRVSSWTHKRYQQDSLYGHSGGVSCLQIIKGQGLVATGRSPNKRLQLYCNLNAGLQLLHRLVLVCKSSMSKACNNCRLFRQNGQDLEHAGWHACCYQQASRRQSMLPCCG